MLIDFQKDLHDGLSIAEVLNKHGLSFKDAFKQAYKKSKQPRTNSIRPNIYKYGKSYQVQATYDGKPQYLGVYTTLKEAEQIKERMEKYNFNKKYLQQVKKELGIKNTREKRGSPKHYYYVRSVKKYKIHKTINGVTYTYGYYDEDTAKKVVEELKKVNWNIEELPAIKQRLGAV